jgi:hypothetical protein
LYEDEDVIDYDAEGRPIPPNKIKKRGLQDVDETGPTTTSTTTSTTEYTTIGDFTHSPVMKGQETR